LSSKKNYIKKKLPDFKNAVEIWKRKNTGKRAPRYLPKKKLIMDKNDITEEATEKWQRNGVDDISNV